MLLLSMLNQCIRNRTNDLELGFHILRLKKEQILKVPKFFAKSLYFGLPFDRLVIDLDCPPQDENLDFSNIKSLGLIDKKFLKKFYFIFDFNYFN